MMIFNLCSVSNSNSRSRTRTSYVMIRSYSFLMYLQFPVGTDTYAFNNGETYSTSIIKLHILATRKSVIEGI